MRPGRTGQFDVLWEGEPIARRGGNWITRKLGAGYPDFEDVLTALRDRLEGESESKSGTSTGGSGP